MNNIEEYQNAIELLKQALNFYADKRNYEINIPQNNALFSLIEMDSGSQARFALEQAVKIQNVNQKMLDDYDKVISETIDAIENHPIDLSDGETNPIDLINYFNSIK